MPRASLSEQIADFALGLAYEDVPGDVVAAAKLHLLDALGCGLAAHGLAIGTAGRAVAGVATERAASVIGRVAPADPRDAALANGMLCHALDFDDTHGDSICHVSAVAAPAALAASEASGASGRDLLTALVAANEVIARIGVAAAPEYMVGGFHPTSVCGVFGATAAGARLFGLDRAAAVHALGIAASMAGGLFAYLGDGSATKPIHAGWAAGSGLTAALLAAAGGEGPREVFEDRFGFFAAYYRGNADEPHAQVASLGRTWETPRIAYKAYPACHFVHGCLDAAAAAGEATGWDAADIETITVAVAEPGIPLVLEPRDAKARPRTEYDAKFSVPYSVATLLVHGRVDLGSYVADALDDPRVLDLAARVAYERRAFATFPEAFPGWVRIAHRDGRMFEADAPYQRGAPENPLSEADVLEKFRANAGLALEADAVAELEDALLALEELDDVRDATRLLAVERTQVPAA